MKIYIDEAGVYRLTRNDLQVNGFIQDAANLARVRLTHHDRELPIEVEQNGDNYAIYFYAAPDENLYSASDVYWLSRTDDANVARMQTRSVEPMRAGPIAETFTTTLRIEENRLYSASAYGEAHWFWQTFTAPATRTITITLAAPVAGNAEMSIALAGASEGPHAVQVLMNEQAVGAAGWNERAAYIYTTTVSNLRAGENALTLRSWGEPGQAEVNLLDYVTITYTREPVALNDQLVFQGSAQNYRARGFRMEPLRLYDITEAQGAQQLVGFQRVRASDATTLSFYDPLPGRRYLALAASAAKSPSAVRAAQRNTLRVADQRADYLMIAPANFMDALQPLVKQRSARGLTVKVIDVEQIYDAFSNGVADPHAIRDFLMYARAQWGKPAPRFVLLVGKASYDYHDYLQGPNKSLVPTFLVSSPHLGEAASDNWFVAASDDDARPTLTLGRIPAKTPEQLRVVVDKIIAYESQTSKADWQRRALFVADDKDEAFTSSSDALAQTLPQDMGVEKVYLSAFHGDVKAARAQIVRQWNAGAALLTYIGHGSIDTWAAGPMFGADNLGEIRNEQRWPILLTPTCLDGFFYHPQKDSLSENLLFKADGGMIAGLVPTGLSLPESQDVMMRALFAELFDNAAPTLGEAITRAKQKIPNDTPELREVIETFALLGDPALVNRFSQK